MFAKLYGEDKDQILVKMDSSENNKAEVRFYFEPDGLGVCSSALQYKSDDPESWDKAENFFKEVTEEKARAFVNNIISKLP